ncbi:NAD(P)H-dependent glycerol-3-phosphate dehydrogenase [Bacillaceae bacterium IKA-2]|nr:NAD(P)H-dependent glycerol-3-phosphate dehydrogenase [Bacillaceae bacterium IKA-2]
MADIAIVGAGSWGSALSIVLADNHHHVRLWGRDEQQIQEINDHHTNAKYLPGVYLPKQVIGHTELKDALVGVEAILIVVPTKAVRKVLAEIRQYLKTPVTFIHASKGIEPDSLKRISEMIEEEIPEALRKSVVVLSGPSHAEEVSRRQPTTVTSSSLQVEAAKYVQDLFMNMHFRVYTNPDLIGVEIGGALKNIIAICIGLTNGLGFGDNAKAALMTRGLAEIARLGIKLGANPLTFAGLSGLGDLIVTCTSVHSRNYRAGNLLGQGQTLEEVLTNMGMAVEGVRTTKAAFQLAKREGIEMPITTVLYDVLFNGKQPNKAAEELMGRVKTHEVENLSLS